MPEEVPKQKKRILLVDDHPVVRAGFSQLLELEPDFQVCGQAGTASEALALVSKHTPDLVIVDISLDGTNGIELIKTVRALHPQVAILVLSVHAESVYAQRALRAGARGYIMKDATTREIFRAVRTILNGELYFSDRLNELVVKKLFSGNPEVSPNPTQSPLDLLTDRELEVFQLIGQGIKTAQIAHKLNLSVKTVETHRAHIKQKLNLNSSMALISEAVRWTTRSP